MGFCYGNVPGSLSEGAKWVHKHSKGSFQIVGGATSLGLLKTRRKAVAAVTFTATVLTVDPVREAVVYAQPTIGFVMLCGTLLFIARNAAIDVSATRAPLLTTQHCRK